MVMRIAIGCDEAGIQLKDTLRDHVASKGYEIVDFGINEGEVVLYPDKAKEIAEAVAKGEFDRGIIICGTGIGMAITANKVPGIRASVAHDVFSAERLVKSNNAQIITLGQRVIGPESAKTVIDAWLVSEFQGGGSLSKVERMIEIDKEYR
ncbi:ribose 5-phosphate isomerase B [Irregularibacter muris]|uniref:Ribose 5-phosphate isomerase B n=2 Tax=Irregularibacter muris TaxID=1796619 RepID=A0AAE3HEM7_9FIRM|nr:ribose 5-phosphate isomerase B [Irregularibacter muris]